MTTPFLGCIADAVAKGEMDPKTAEFAREVHADALAAADQALGPVEADRAAGAAVVTALQREAERVERLRRMTVRNRLRNLAGAADYMKARGYENVLDVGGAGHGGKPPKDGWVIGGKPPPSGPYKRGGVMADYLKEIIDGMGGVEGSSVPSVKGLYQSVRGKADAMMVDLTERFESGSGLPVRGRAILDNIVREARGSDTGDNAAKVLAQAFRDTAEFLRKRRNAAGGDTGKIENWFPQLHDAIRIKRAGVDQWVDDIMPTLDRAVMIDKVTGKPFTDKRLRAVLNEVQPRIVSQGGIDREVGDHLGKGALANQRMDSRFLAFTDEGWFAYQAKYGRGDPYTAMVSHIDSMARDIARMEVLGPNPDRELEWLANTAQRQTQIEQARAGAADEGKLNHTDGRIKSAVAMYRQFAGEVSGPFGSANVIADVSTNINAVTNAAFLGKAALNDLSNIVVAAQVRAGLGMTRIGDFGEYWRYMLIPSTRAKARRTGLIFERARDRHGVAVADWLRAQTGGSKFYRGTNALSRLLPQWVSQGGLLNVSTKAQRWVFQSEMMGHLADHRGLTLVEMAANGDRDVQSLGAALRARGFSEADWGKVRATPLDDDGFLTPMAVGAAHGDDLQFRLAEMIERETRDAVPEPILWSQAQLAVGTDPGSVAGVVVRSITKWRSFSVTQSYRWGRHYIHKAHLAGQRAEAVGMPWPMVMAIRAAPLVINSFIAGAGIVLAGDLLNGLDPRPLWSEDDPKEAHHRATKFVAAAMAKGGGQGVLGDFFYSVESRSGKSAPMSQFGAPLGMVADAKSYFFDNAVEAMAGEETHFGRETARMAGRYSPFSTLWWTRTAWQRGVTDQMQKLIDPEADEDFERRVRRQEKDYGMSPWWRPGEALPDRAPDLTAVTGEE